MILIVKNKADTIILNKKISTYTLNIFDDIYTMAQLMARHFPHPDQCITGIYELLFNALEHGNLGIGFEAKTELIRQGLWKQEIAHRLSSPDYTQKEVTITLTQDAHTCRLSICDQGDGFDWQSFLQRPVFDRRPNGRGLWIALNSHFDSVSFNALGNEVTCTASYGPKENPLFVANHQRLKALHPA